MGSTLSDELANITQIEAGKSVYLSLGSAGSLGFRKGQLRDYYDIQLQAVNCAYNGRASKYNFPAQQDFSK